MRKTPKITRKVYTAFGQRKASPDFNTAEEARQWGKKYKAFYSISEREVKVIERSTNVNDNEHTPTPWKLVFDKYLLEGYQEPTIEAKGFKVVARVERVNIDVAEQMANAAFIVQAVNEYTSLKAENTRMKDLHDELLCALRFLLSRYANDIIADDRITYKKLIAKAEALTTEEK